MEKLWTKNVAMTEEIEKFTVGRDREMDLYLAKYDVLGSMAHITMLQSIDLLTADELQMLLKELKAIYAQAEKGEFVIELVFSIGFLFALYKFGGDYTRLDFGFVRTPSLGIFYYILMVPVIIYLTNAVNLTDGVDGLCGSVTFVAMLIFTVCCAIVKENEMSLFTMALAGGCLGFLLWNLNPAKCFMGDTGSMFLGAAVTGVGLVLHRHLLLLLVALVYILEALSVVIQVSYFKYTKKKYGEGRRIFKMTPIHCSDK